MGSSLIYEDESYEIRGAIYEVYKEIGIGLLEAVYQNCLEIEFQQRKIPFKSQPELKISYKNQEIKQTYRPDFVCYGKILVEIKSVETLLKIHHFQLQNYLKITGYKLGFLVNFNHYPGVEMVRIIM